MPGKGIPEIQWGTYYDVYGKPHVAPTIEGYLMSGHKLSERCACSPTLDIHPKITIVVHHIVH